MKNKEEWYEIADIEKFVESTRVLVFDAFGKQNYDIENLVTEISNLKEHEKIELNSIFTQQEAMNIVRGLVKKRKGVYTINHIIYSKIVESFNERFIGNMLANLTSKGLLESAFDTEANDFVFWIKDNNEKNNQRPQTD